MLVLYKQLPSIKPTTWTTSTQQNPVSFLLVRCPRSNTTQKRCVTSYTSIFEDAFPHRPIADFSEAPHVPITDSAVNTANRQ